MESAGSEGEVDGDRLAMELADLRAALDDLRRRPIALDADTLRHVVTASFSEANAPPPNLLVTAIRRLDRLDARLESIEAALGGQGTLPAAAPGARGRPAPSPASVASMSPVAYASPAPDAEAIADALARRLAGMLPGAPTSGAPDGGATVADLVAALRPLLPGAARSVLRRAGREPSPQAVEVLHQAALAALEEAAGSLGPLGGPGFTGSGPAPAGDHQSRGFAPLPPRPALAPAPPPPAPPTPMPPPPPPLDVEALAATIAVRVTASVAASVSRQLTVPQPAVIEPTSPPPVPEPPPAPVDPAVVAEAVVARLADQPAPQAVLSALAMAPLLSAVGNVEAAVAQLADPDPDPEADVVGALGRLEAGIDALAHALEEDRGAQADEVRRGFTEVADLVRNELATQVVPSDGGTEAAEGRRAPVDGEPQPVDDQPVDGQIDEGRDDEGQDGGIAKARPDQDRTLAAVMGVHRRLDEVSRQLAPLAGADQAGVSEGEGRRLERSTGNILTALAALADHIQEQSSLLQAGLDEIASAVKVPQGSGADLGRVQHDLAQLGARLDELVAGTAADRQRFQRLGGTIDGLSELLGRVSERLDGAAPLPESRSRTVVPPPEAEADTAQADPATPPPSDSTNALWLEDPPERDAELVAEELDRAVVDVEGDIAAVDVSDTTGDGVQPGVGDEPPHQMPAFDDHADPTQAGISAGSARRRRRRGARRR